MGKIRFEPVPPLSDAEVRAHRDYSQSLGLPEIVPGKAGAAAPRLAVVGGGPAVINHIDELRAWDGEVWAVNRTWEWCRDNGIDATFYTIDQITRAYEGVRRAVLGDPVRPQTFDDLIAQGAHIELVRLGRGSILPASTSAGTAPMIACWRGHKHVTFFGCESSYPEGRTHINKNETDRLGSIWVECGDREYVTCAQFIMQAEWIAKMARAFPEFIEVRGAGFLPALVLHGDYDVTHVNRQLHERLTA